jgi:hypothetical protein
LNASNAASSNWKETFIASSVSPTLRSVSCLHTWHLPSKGLNGTILTVRRQEEPRLRLSYIQAQVRRRRFRIAAHALTEASKDGIRARDITHAILTGETIESYPERERLLILGYQPEHTIPIHVVCDYSDPDEVVAVTVYVPGRGEWIADRTRKQ